MARKNIIDNELRSLVYSITLELMQKYFPEGRIAGKYYYFLNPFRNDTKIGSCVIYIKGPRQGKWVDFSSNQKGDIFDLLARVTGEPVHKIAMQARKAFIEV